MTFPGDLFLSRLCFSASFHLKSRSGLHDGHERKVGKEKANTGGKIGSYLKYGILLH